MVDVTTAFVKVTQPLISMCQAGVNKATLLAGYTELKAAADALSAAMVAKGASGGSLGEVQILGSLIGVGLSDTGTADATNLLVSTQQAFSGIDWITTNAVIVDSVATAPDSTTTASTLTETTASGSHWIAQGFYTAAVAAQYSFSLSLEQGLRTRVHLVVRDSLTVGNNVTVTFDLAGAAIGIAAAVNGTFATPSATITAKSNGFYLCVLTATTSGSGNYDVEIYGDSGSGSGAASTSYTGNSSAPAFTLWGAGVWAGAAGTYVPLNANSGSIGSTVQQIFAQNGGTTAYWGTQTPNAYIASDAGVPVVYTRQRFAPRPSSTSAHIQTFGFAPDYAQTLAGALIQTDVADSTFASPTTVDTIPATLPAVGGVPYYPRFVLSERTIPAGPAARYIRLMPPTTAFGGVSAWQVFAKAGTSANSCPVQPVISPSGGRFPSLSPAVTITSLTSKATIYYTTDGSTPTTSSTLYSGPFVLSISSGAQITVKAIAYLSSLSTPTSLVTTSAPFNGYGYKPNDPFYDTSGILIEGHAGDQMYDPNTGAYYWVGRLMNINSIHFPSGSALSLNGYQAVFLYKGVSLDPKDPGGLLNWQNMGDILGQVTGYPRGPRYRLIYNALNNNYLIWVDVVDPSNNSVAFYASTSGSNILGPWAWNLTPITISGGYFADFDLFLDSDNVSAYVVFRNSNTGTTIQQLNTSYNGVTGSPLLLTNASLREGIVLFKYPNVTGGTYFIISGQGDDFDSTQAMDLRYIYNTGSSPTANSWSAVPSSGTNCWDFNPQGGNYNGQAGIHLTPQGCVQPMITLDFWLASSLYGSNYVGLPINITSKTTLGIGHPATWDPSTLATTYSLFTITLSATSFTVGNAQGTVIGTASGYLVLSWVTLTDSHSGAVQLVGGVIQVGPTPPGTAGSFNISLTETPTVGTPKTTIISITENAVGGAISGTPTIFTTTQAINLTSLATSPQSDWAAYSYNSSTPGVTQIERKSTGGSAISVLSQVGAQALGASNHVASIHWGCTWTDGTPDASVSGEGWQVFSASSTIGTGMSFTVPADTTSRTLLIYVWVSFATGLTTGGKLTATLSDGSAGPYVDTTIQQTNGSVSILGQYSITYSAASATQSLLIDWTNNQATAQDVGIFAAVIE